jgi:hypothetical protein
LLLADPPVWREAVFYEFPGASRQLIGTARTLLFAGIEVIDVFLDL